MRLAGNLDQSARLALFISFPLLIQGMNLLRLRAFTAVAELRHVGQAAERLGLAQPALSQQLRMLEREVGTALVRRAGRGIGLTEAGAAFLPEAMAVLAQADRAITVARRTARGEVGTIRIGYVATAMLQPHLPRLLHAFRAEVPEAEVLLDDMPVQELLLALERSTIDVAVVREPVGTLPGDLQAAPFGQERLLATMPTALATTLPPAISLRSMAPHPFILVRDPHGMGLAHQVHVICEGAGFSPRVSLRVSNPFAVAGLVAAGFGVGIIPASLAHFGMPGVTFLPLTDEGAETTLSVIHRPSVSGPLVWRLLAPLRYAAAK